MDFFKNGGLRNWITITKKKKQKSRFYLTPYTKVISKSNRYINVKIKQN